MAKGTPAKGKQTGKRNFMKCRRCGNTSYHKSKKVCSSCGFGKSSKLRNYSWKNIRKIKRIS